MNPIVGIDVGGTFTDLVLVEGNGSLLLGKVPLNANQPSCRGYGRFAFHGTRCLAPVQNLPRHYGTHQRSS